MGTFRKPILKTFSRRLGIMLTGYGERARKSLNLGHLLFIEEAPLVRRRSTGTRTCIYWRINKKPPREFLASLEASHDHLLITPPSDFKLQKVRGLVVGFTWLRRIVYNSNGSRAANSVKLIFGLSGEIPYLGGTLELLKVKEACQFMNQITGQNY